MPIGNDPQLEQSSDTEQWEGATPTTVPTTMSSPFTTRGAAEFPIAGTKNAPKTFKGKAEEVDRFFRHYQGLCDRYGVTSSKDKLENLTQYCSRHVKELCEALQPYRDQNWAEFVRQFRELFNADRDDRRFRIRDLEHLIQKARKGDTVKDLRAWRRYKREHIRIAGWLQEHDKITEDEYNTYFWQGIPKPFRERLENRLMGQHPTHDISTPFSLDQIEKAAKSLLQEDRFDRERMPSDDEESDEDENNIFTSDSEYSDSSSDEKETFIKRLASRIASSTKEKDKGRDKSKDKEEDEAKAKKGKDESQEKRKEGTGKVTKQEKEVADLIDQMGKLTINDPSYTALYYKALCLDARVEKILPAPMPSRPSNSQSFRDATPHVAGSTPQRFNQERRCYGCGDPKHIGAACPKLAELVQKGILTRDSQGRFTMKDGSRIWRTSRDEPLADAALRSISAQSHYISVDDDDWEENDSFMEAYPVWADEVDDEDQYPVLVAYDDPDDNCEFPDEESVSSDLEGNTYAAERSERAIRAARREANAKATQRTRKSATPEPATPPVARAGRSDQKLRFAKTPVPIEVQKQTFNPETESGCQPPTFACRRDRPRSSPTSA